MDCRPVTCLLQDARFISPRTLSLIEALAAPVDGLIRPPAMIGRDPSGVDRREVECGVNTGLASKLDPCSQVLIGQVQLYK
jgi:hypothetical protein